MARILYSMNSTKRRYVLGVILLVLMGGIGLLINHLSPTIAYADSDSAAASVNKSVVDANTGFALRLLRELQSEQGGRTSSSPP